MAVSSAAIIPRQGTANAVKAALASPQLVRLAAGMEGLGRKGYGARALLGACLIRSLYGLATWAETARLISDHPGLQAILGCTPSRFACYRFNRRLLRQPALVEECACSLIQTLKARHPRLGEDVSVDSTDLPAWANGQKYKYAGGPERTAWSDPDASWGHRSAVSTRKGGGFYGYKLHAAVCSQTGLPLAWEVVTGKGADMRQVGPLLDQLKGRGIHPRTAAMDRGYDYNGVYMVCASYGVLPVVACRRNSGTGAGPIPRQSDRFKALYQARASVEREFGRLKHHLSLTPLRSRGLQNVRLHADLCLITRLAGATGSQYATAS